jgi:NADPH-dependent 2,4-dienoyl-CoA reductase/sulfur reductase-like enzyme
MPHERFGEFLPHDAAPVYTAELGEAILAFLARSRARLMLVQLEDIAGEVEQANLPGTSDTHPNWRRRLSARLDDCSTGPELQRVAALVNEERRRAAAAALAGCAPCGQHAAVWRRAGRDSGRIETVVVGAGVIGLAAARALALAGREVVVLEKAYTIGFETSSRNSEVIHGGLYYPKGSLKATACVEGRERLYEYCRDHGVPHEASAS